MITSFRERAIVWGLKIPILDAVASYHQATGPWQRTTIASYSLNIEASFCVEVSRLKLVYSEGVGLEFVIYSNECLLCSEGVSLNL